jgi:hypothetical protein
MVDDPATDVVIMYVNGAPVLRNALGVHGINGIDDMSWILGGGFYDGVRDSGFLGCIGETRVVDHALTADQWLTARAVIADETPVTPIPTADPTTPRSLVALA